MDYRQNTFFVNLLEIAALRIIQGILTISRHLYLQVRALIMDATALMLLSQTAAENAKSPKVVSTKLQTVRQRCLIYWVDDRLVSIEPLSSVVEKNQVKEGAVCKIKWKGKGPYLGKLIKISGEYYCDRLTSNINLRVTLNLQLRLSNCSLGYLTRPNTTSTSLQ